MGNGFRVSLISYNELAKIVGRELAPGDCETILFVAEQLRFSDDEVRMLLLGLIFFPTPFSFKILFDVITSGQMETWRREFQRIEEAGDEEGFEEL